MLLDKVTAESNHTVTTRSQHAVTSRSQHAVAARSQLQQITERGLGRGHTAGVELSQEVEETRALLVPPRRQLTGRQRRQVGVQEGCLRVTFGCLIGFHSLNISGIVLAHRYVRLVKTCRWC